MKYKAIIWDIDGTLVDTIAMNMYPLIQVVYEQTKKLYTYEEIRHCFSMSGKQTMAYFGFDYDTVYPRWVELVNKYPKKAEPFAGVLEVVEAISKMPISQAIVSAKLKKQYEIDMDEKFRSYFPVTVLADDTNKHKPDPEPILLCVRKLDLDISEVLYIGDALSDGKACVNAGCDFAYAKWNGLEIKDMPGVKYILNQPSDLLEILKRG